MFPLIFKNIQFNSIDEVLKNEDIKVEFLKKFKITNNIFEKLIKSKLTNIDIIYLSSNIYLSTSNLNKLEEYNIDNSIINILKHENVDLKIVDKYLKLNDKVFNITMAHNKVLNSSHYKYLYDLNDLDVNISLASNDKVEIKILEDLYIVNNKMINQCLCLNISTPIEVLIKLRENNDLKLLVNENKTYTKCCYTQ